MSNKNDLKKSNHCLRKHRENSKGIDRNLHFTHCLLKGSKRIEAVKEAKPAIANPDRKVPFESARYPTMEGAKAPPKP